MPFINLIPFDMQQAQQSQQNYYQMLAAEREAQRQAIDNRRNQFTSALSLRALDDQDRARAENRMLADRELARRERDTLLGLRQYGEQQTRQREQDAFNRLKFEKELGLSERQIAANEGVAKDRIKERDMGAFRKTLENEMQFGQPSGEQVKQRALLFGFTAPEAESLAATAEGIVQQTRVLPFFQQKREELVKKQAELGAFDTKTAEKDRLKFAVDNWRKVVGDAPLPQASRWTPSRYNVNETPAGPELTGGGFLSNAYPGASSLDVGATTDTFRAALLQRRAQLAQEQSKLDAALEKQTPDFVRRQYQEAVGAPAGPAGGAATPAAEEVRMTKDGRMAVYDAATKKFLRYAN